MILMIQITLEGDFTTTDVARALQDAGERAGGQTERGILPYPLRVDEVVQLGSAIDTVAEATLTRVA